MDDIDDLLDEVESKFCSSSSKSSSKSSSASKQTRLKSPKQQKNELDNIIDDIIADDGLDTILKSNVSNTAHKKSSSSVTTGETSKVKCISVFIGGTSIGQGYSASGNKRSCDKLHCTSCDNKIVSFDGYEWLDKDCEYLHFRNSYPDFERLKSKLMKKKAYRAFCCQCCWVSVKEITELKKEKPGFKWICRKH